MTRKKHLILIPENRDCYECGTMFEVSELKKIEENFYCESCIADKFANCFMCGEYTRIDESHEYDEKLYCKDCFDENFTICVECGKIIPHDTSYFYSDEPYCESCFSGSYGHCNECGESFCWVDLHEYHGGWVCFDCHSGSGSDSIHDHYYIPNYHFHKLVFENTLYMGIELEVETEEDVSEVTDTFINDIDAQGLSDELYLKEDGSLSNGFEVVTHPMTWKYHRKIKWNQILKSLRKSCRSHDIDRCGLHVHVNKDFFTESKNGINKLAMFFSNNRNEIQTLSRRTDNQIHAWTKFIQYSLDDVKNKSEYQNNSRYSAINVNTNTIEIRIGRGTLNLLTFTAWIQFIDAVCHFTRENSIMSMTWTGFKDWIKNKNRYGKLEKWMKNKNLVVKE